MIQTRTEPNVNINGEAELFGISNSNRSKGEEKSISSGNTILQGDRKYFQKGRRKASSTASQKDEIIIEPHPLSGVLNIHKAQQQFFNEEDHFSLSMQMKKFESEDSVHVDSIGFTGSKQQQQMNGNKSKRGSVQNIPQESSLFSVLGPFSQNRNSIRKLPSEMVSMLNSQTNTNFNFLYKNDGNQSVYSEQKRGSAYLLSANNNNNNNGGNSQHLNSSFTNSNGMNSSFLTSNHHHNSYNNNNNNININNNNNINNSATNLSPYPFNNASINQFIINNSDLISAFNYQPKTKNTPFQNDAQFLSNQTTSLQNIPPHNLHKYNSPQSNRNYSPASNKNNLSLSKEESRLKSMSPNKKEMNQQLQNLKVNQWMLLQEKEINERQQQKCQFPQIFSFTKKEEEEKKQKNKIISVSSSSSTKINRLSDFLSNDCKHLRRKVLKLLGEFYFDFENPHQKMTTLLGYLCNLVQKIHFLISLSFILLQMKNKKKQDQRLFGNEQMVFILISLVSHIVIIQYFLLKIIASFDRKKSIVVGNIYFDFICLILIFAHLAVRNFFDPSKEKSCRLTSLIFKGENYKIRNFNQWKVDLISLFGAILEVLLNSFQIDVHFVIALFIRLAVLFQVNWVYSSTQQLKGYFLRNKIIKMFFMMKMVIISIVTILVFVNAWCIFSTQESILSLKDQNIAQEHMGVVFQYFFQQILSNLLNLNSQIQIDPKNTLQIILLTIQQLTLGLLFMHILSLFIKHKYPFQYYNSIQSLLQYCEDLNTPVDIIDNTLLYLLENERIQSNDILAPPKMRGLSQLMGLLPPLHRNPLNKQLENILFAHIPFLNAFYTSLNSKLQDYIEEVTFLPDTVVIKENQLDDCSLYFILKGEAIVYHQGTPNSQIQEVKTLKKMEYFGELSLLTGLPRKASVVSKGHLTILKLNRIVLLELISNSIVDYQSFCMFKDQITNSQNYSYIHLNCYLCGDEKHITSHCPLVHYKMDLVSYVNNYYKDSQDQIRQQLIRSRRKFKAVLIIRNIQRAVSGILDDTDIQGILSEAYSSDLHFDENNQSRNIQYDSALLSIEFSEQQNIERDPVNFLPHRKNSSSQIFNPSTPDRKQFIRHSNKLGSLEQGEDDFEQQIASMGDQQFSGTQISNKMLKKSKTNPKEDKNYNPIPRAPILSKQLLQNQNSITGTKYSRSHFHPPVNHSEASKKEEIMSQLDLSERAFEFAAYFPSSNAFQVIEAVNKNSKLIENIFPQISSKNKSRRGSSPNRQSKNHSPQFSIKNYQLDKISNIPVLSHKSISNYTTPKQNNNQYKLTKSQYEILGSQFFQVPNYGSTIHHYSNAQREYNEKMNKKIIEQLPNSNFLSILDESGDGFSQF